MNKFTSRIRLALVGVLVFALIAITSKVSLSQTPITYAKAQISGPGITGTLRLGQNPVLVWVNLDLQGDTTILTPGLHGIHIHQTASCEEPGFTSAGGHFDPGPYGNSTPVYENHPYHTGDLPNIEIDESGKGRLKTVTTRFSISEGPLSIFDSDGSAIIVHQLPDLLKAGGTAAEAGGGRLACGVIEPDLSTGWHY